MRSTPTAPTTAGRPAIPALPRLLVRAARALARGAQQDRDRQQAQRDVRDAAASCGDAAQRGAVAAALRAVADERLHEPPERVAAKADGDRDQQPVAERLVLDRLHRSALIGRLPGRMHRDLDREQADGGVDHAARDESEPGQRLERRAVGHLTTGGSGLCLDAAHVGSPPLGWAGTHTVIAAGSTSRR